MNGTTLDNLVQSLFEYMSNTRQFGGNTDAQSLKSLFGFVPVKEGGRVSLYIKIGGPEQVVYGKVVTGSGEISEFPKAQLTMDRDMIAPSVAQDAYGLTAREIRQQYPFRIYNSRLQYSKDQNTPYKNLTNESAILKAQIVGGIVTALVECIGLLGVVTGGERAVQNVLEQAKTADGVKTIYNLFIQKMASDLKAYGNHTILQHFDDKSAIFFWWGGESEFHLADELFFEFLVQSGGLSLENVPRNQVDFNTFKTDVLDPGLAAACNSVRSTLVTSGTDVLPLVKNYVNMVGVISDEEVAARIATLQKTKRSVAAENVALRKELKSANARVPSDKLKYVAIAAGATSAYFAVQQESAKSLEMWQKASIIAIGGLLGMVPGVNYVTIAAMPIIVDKGLGLARKEEFRKRVQEGVDSVKNRIANLGGSGTTQEA